MSNHSQWGGSVCKRYRNCPGSVAACAAIPKLPSSPYAEEGTKAHTIAEWALRNDVWAFTETGQTVGGVHADVGMVRAVNVYLEAIRAEIESDPCCTLQVEQRFELPITTAPEGAVFGRNDCLVYLPGSAKLIVFDYKHGYQPVDAEDNDQGKFYAAGAAMSDFARDWPLKEIEIVIVQPNSRDVSEAGAVKRWSWPVVDVFEFLADIEGDIARTLEPDAPRVPGEWCRWCDAAPVCEERAQRALADAGMAFADVAVITPADLPRVEEIDVSRLVKVLAVAKVFKEWGDKIEDRILAMLEAGQAVPGYKLVEKLARRKWQSSGDEVAGYLAMTYGLDVNDVIPPTLVGISEAEKLLAGTIKDKAALRAAKEDLSLRFTVKESSGVTIAPEHDKREPVIRNPAAAYAGARVEADNAQ